MSATQTCSSGHDPGVDGSWPVVEEALRRRLREVAATRERFGYRRLTAVPRREGWNKRVYRLSDEEASPAGGGVRSQPVLQRQVLSGIRHTAGGVRSPGLLCGRSVLYSSLQASMLASTRPSCIARPGGISGRVRHSKLVSWATFFQLKSEHVIVAHRLLPYSKM
jgi:hypothetical protein